MVPQDLGKPVEGNAARQVMHVMHADIAGEPGKRRRQVVKELPCSAASGWLQSAVASHVVSSN